jgi:hypothetical protein
MLTTLTGFGFRENVVRCGTCLAVLFVVLVPGLAHGRGLWVEIAAGPTTTITATFGTGEPLADAPFSVLPPGTDKPAESGATDKSGRLSFKPDRTGTWLVQLSGADGIDATVTVDIDRRALSTPMPVRAEAHFDKEEKPTTRAHQRDDT